MWQIVSRWWQLSNIFWNFYIFLPRNLGKIMIQFDDFAHIFQLGGTIQPPPDRCFYGPAPRFFMMIGGLVVSMIDWWEVRFVTFPIGKSRVYSIHIYIYIIFVYIYIYMVVGWMLELRPISLRNFCWNHRSLRPFLNDVEWWKVKGNLFSGPFIWTDSIFGVPCGRHFK